MGLDQNGIEAEPSHANRSPAIAPKTWSYLKAVPVPTAWPVPKSCDR